MLESRYMLLDVLLHYICYKRYSSDLFYHLENWKRYAQLRIREAQILFLFNYRINFGPFANRPVRRLHCT